MRIFCGLFLSALLFLSGCSAPRVATATTRFPNDPPPAGGPAPAPAAVVPTPAEPVAQAEIAPEPAITNVAVVPDASEFPPAPLQPPVNPPVFVPATNWIRADRWLQEHGATDILIRPGTKSVRFAGVANFFGFDPVLREGAVWIHPLDVEKNLVPLTRSKPAFTARSVVIDPGHGGINAGTRAITGNRFEKDFTLDWAVRLKALLEAKGWTVFLTRTNDTDVSLSQRVDMSEASKAALFISLHFNSAFPNQKPTGLETYCLTPTGMPSNLVRQYADDPAGRFPNNQFDEDNVRLAMRVQRSLLASTGALDRGVRRARFMDVLRWQNRPAILIEGGYLSNPEDARKISTPVYRQKLAAGVAKALE